MFDVFLGSTSNGRGRHDKWSHRGRLPVQGILSVYQGIKPASE